jgi:hypothetical protein
MAAARLVRSALDNKVQGLLFCWYGVKYQRFGEACWVHLQGSLLFVVIRESGGITPFRESGKYVASTHTSSCAEKKGSLC